jgi:hypothetical protein
MNTMNQQWNQQQINRLGFHGTTTSDWLDNFVGFSDRDLSDQVPWLLSTDATGLTKYWKDLKSQPMES